MRKNPRILAIVGLMTATFVLAGCTGGTDPLANNTAKGGVSPASTVSPTPTVAPSLEPAPNESSAVEPEGEAPKAVDGESTGYRDQEFILGYKVADMKPAPIQVENYPEEYLDTAIADTLHFLDVSSSFTEYWHKEIPDSEKELLIADYADLTTPRGQKNLEEQIDHRAFYLIPHRTPELTDEQGKELAWDSSRDWKISYSDFKFVKLVEKEDKDPQSLYSIVQEVQIPVEGGKIAVLKTRIFLFMEYGFNSWVLDGWDYEGISSEWVQQ